MKKIFLHPLFLIYLIYLICLGKVLEIATYVLVVSLHELGHFFCAKRLGYKLQKVVLMPYGVCLNYESCEFDNNDEILIAMCGPIVNLFLYMLTLSLWWLCPILYSYSQVFFYSNLVLFLFNILPCYPLDGGRILASLLSKKINKKNAIKITILFNYIVCLILIILFIYSLFLNIFNYNLIIIALFLFMGVFEPNKYSKYNYYSINKSFNHLQIKGNGVKCLFIYSNEKIFKIIPKLSKNKFNILYILLPNDKVKVITQIMLYKLIIKYTPETKFSEIKEMFI